MEPKMRVAVRVRPKSQADIAEELEEVVFTTTKNMFIKIGDHLVPENCISIDHLFTKTDNNKNVYCVMQPMTENFFNGVNTTLFVYGRKDTGKTHTLLGNGIEKGIVHLALDEIHQRIAADSTRVYSLKAAFLEVKHEKLHDLFAEMTILHVPETRDVNVILTRCQAMNKARCHVIFSLQLNCGDIGSQEIRTSTWNFVELADPNYDEDADLYKHNSLKALCDVLQELNINDRHVNYNRHLLTSLLTKTLTRDSQTMLITTVSGTKMRDTVHSMKYPRLVKNAGIMRHESIIYGVKMPTDLLRHMSVLTENIVPEGDVLDEDDNEIDEYLPKNAEVSNYIQDIPNIYYKAMNFESVLDNLDVVPEVSIYTNIPQKTITKKSRAKELVYNLLGVEMSSDSSTQGGSSDGYPAYSDDDVDDNDPGGIDDNDETPEYSIRMPDIQLRMANPPADEEAAVDIQDSLSMQDDNEMLEKIAAEANGDQEKLKNHILQLLKKNRDAQYMVHQLQLENIRKERQLKHHREEIGNMHNQLEDHKRTLTDFVNTELSTAKEAYKSTLKEVEAAYKDEISALEKHFTETEQELRHSRGRYDNGDLEAQDRENVVQEQAEPVRNDPLPINVFKRIKHIERYKKMINIDMHKMRSHFESVLAIICPTCQLNIQCTNENDCLDSSCLRVINNKFKRTLTKATTLLSKINADIIDLRKQNASLRHDNKCIKLTLYYERYAHSVFIKQYNVHMQEKDKIIKKLFITNFAQRHEDNDVAMVVENQEQVLVVQDNDEPMHERFLASDMYENIESEEDNSLVTAIKDLRFISIQNGFPNKIEELICTTLEMDKMLNIINILYNNMNRFMVPRDTCTECRVMADLMQLKVVQLASLKSCYNFWSKTIRVEDRTILQFLKIITALENIINSIEHRKGLRTIQLFLENRKSYLDTCLAVTVNKRSFIHNVRYIIDANLETFRDVAHENFCADGVYCRFRQVNKLSCLLFILVEKRIAMALTYLDILNDCSDEHWIHKKLEKLDRCILRNETNLKLAIPDKLDVQELKHVEMEYAYLKALYTSKERRVHELEMVIKGLTAAP